MVVAVALAGAGALVPHWLAEVQAAPPGQQGGIFSLMPVNEISKQLPELSDPDVAGISVRFRWSLIEPQPGKYNWEPVDRSIALAQKFGKKVMIRIMGGASTPEWVFQAGAKWAQPRYEPEKLRRMPSQRAQRLTGIKKAPVVWDPVYLKHWLALVQAFGQRYDGNPTIYSIQMAGGGLGGEMGLRPEFHWERYGYSDAVIIDTWKKIIDAYQESFPHTPTNLDILEPIRQKSNAMQPVVDYCLSRYPGKVYLQNNGLNARGGGRKERGLLRQAAAKTRIGYQMTGGSEWIDSVVGDRWTAFSYALQDGASYLEVYHGDLINPVHKAAVHKLAIELSKIK